MSTDVAESVRTSGRGFQGIFFFLFFFRSDKRKVPSSPRPPHIFNTRFVLHFFSFFFLFSTCTHGRVTRSRDARVRVS